MSRVPHLPPSFPRRGNRFTHALGHAVLAAWGWRVEGAFPDRPKVLAIVAPHTSNWDFPLGIAAVYALGLRVRFLAKHTLFKPPLGWLMRWFGGLPVIRESPQGLVAQVVQAIEREGAIFLAVTPAGTRSASLNWKSGFYHIAHAARIPIIPIAFDARQRVIRLFPAFEASGNYAVDLPRLLQHYEGIRGLRS